MTKPLVPALLLAVLLAAAPARAGWQSMSASDFSMDPPPAAGSAAYQQDFATLLDWQDKRTPQQCSLASSMPVPDFETLYRPSGILTQDELDRVQPFLSQVSRAVARVAEVFKREYARPRPYNEDSRIAPCAAKPGGAKAYPSGHATEGAVDACVLGQIFPDRADKLTAWGAYVGQLRVIAGVHHPSDVAAGQALAADICSWLSSQDDFNAQVARLKGS